MSDILSSIGIVPGQPFLPHVEQVIAQEEFQRGTQAWFDNEYITTRWPSYRLVHRIDDAFVVIERQRDGYICMTVFGEQTSLDFVVAEHPPA